MLQTIALVYIIAMTKQRYLGMSGIGLCLVAESEVRAFLTAVNRSKFKAKVN